MKNGSKKYRSLIGFLLLLIVVAYVWYWAFSAYLWEHSYYSTILSTGSNRWIVIVAMLCSWAFPLTYRLLSDKVNTKKLIMRLGIWAGVFWLVHSHIKWDPIWFGNVITIFNTLLLFALGTYLILWFSAIWSWISRKIIKFKQHRRQEILLNFWIWMCGFIIIVQLLLWIGILYGIVSRILFLWLWFMIRYERKQLSKQEIIINNILQNIKIWITFWNWNMSSKQFRNWKLWFIALFVLILLSITYLYMWIQNAFTPYSTAWDANHEYMYIPKILAENAWIYRWNTLANNMPWMWHQFLAFIFSLTGCTNWRFGLSPDNIAISMNNISSLLVLIFGIAIIFQIFTLTWSKKSNQNADIKKWNDEIVQSEFSNKWWIISGWSILLLWLTSWMWAFLVIVDNKTDLWVMALSLLALLAGLIFLQNRENSDDKKDLLKYVIIAWIMFWFAALAKITAFVDFALFGLLLMWLWFSPIVCLWAWMVVMWLVRKLNVLTSAVMISDSNATWLIIIGAIITLVWLILYFSKSSNRKKFGTSFIQLIILWVSFLIPFLLFKLPWTTISQIKTNNFSPTWAIKSVFLSKDSTKKINKALFAQNTNENVTETQNNIDLVALSQKDNQTFAQCSAVGNIYSEEELSQDLQEIIWDGASEDLWRYIWYGWKEFTSEKNGFYWLLKLLRPTNDACYWLNHDAKVLCTNADVIDSFKIDDIRAIYENWIKDQTSEAWLLLKNAIDAYNSAKSEWKIWFWNTNAQLFYDEIVAIRQYYQSHSIYSNTESVNIPYRYIVPLNISFNWSLQNLSSYYTDIWFVWVIVYIMLLISLPYAIIKKNKLLTNISLTTLIWWWIRWIIWSAILRYGTVLISWTMITFALFMDQLFRNDKNQEQPKILPWMLICVIVLCFWIQLLYNFMRISSQWANSVFVWYKWNVGTKQIINENLQTESKVKYWYWWKDIFDLQFPQYNPIIHALSDRNNEDGVIVAWTYIQYFLWNQRNIKSDWMLSNFWLKTSDWDLCKTYRRLKNDKTRYLIIDPNIWTVTMWEWNESLFYRFFGKLNSDKSEIEIDGTITTLIRLAQNWYLKLLSTNNIWTKYAFEIDDDTIRQYFGQDLSEEQIILTRAKMAVLKYFNDANDIFNQVFNIFIERMSNNPEWAIKDLADMFWLEIDSNNVANVVFKILNWAGADWSIQSLNNDERSVVISYLNIYTSLQQWNAEIAQQLLANSVSGWSQVIALELN